MTHWMDVAQNVMITALGLMITHMYYLIRNR